MELTSIIELARRDDVRMAIRNGQLGVVPALRLSDELREQLRTNRDAVVLAIKNAPARLVNLAIHAGIHEQGYQFTSAEIRKPQRESDLQDSVNCRREELQAWASALAIRATQRRAKVPPDWNKNSDCSQCGLVYSDHGMDTLSCGWCWMRHAGLPFPQPESAK